MIKVDRWIRARAGALGVNPDYVNPASVDVSLGEKIIEYWLHEDGHRVCHENHYLEPGESFWFEPGRFYLAHTEEFTTLPDDVCAQLILKSSSGRKGLDHAHSGWGDPGFAGQWTFEFVAHRPVEFKRGQRIAQLVFMQCDGTPDQTYATTGRYQGQTGVTEAKPE